MPEKMVPVRISMVKATSPVKSFLIHSRYVRYVGRSLFSTYDVQVDDRTKITLSSKGLDESIVKEVFVKRPYEKHFAPRSGQTVVDVGAHVGCFSIRSSRLVGAEGKVVAIEPASRNFSLLQVNLKHNGANNVTPLNIGLGEVEQKGELLLTGHGYGNTTISSVSSWEKVTGSEPIQIRSLDQVVQDHHLKSVDFLKVDAEGVELSVLKGAKKTLDQFSPVIVGEAHPRISDSGEAILDYLRAQGYEGKLEPELEWNPVFHAWKK